MVDDAAVCGHLVQVPDGGQSGPDWQAALAVKTQETDFQILAQAYPENRKNFQVNGSARFLRCVAMFICVFAFLASAQFYATSAAAETRTLNLYFTHTKQRAKITFKRNGRYVKSGLRKLNRFLRDHRRNEPTRMDPELFDLVWEVYKKSGSRKPIHVISGYRSPKTNRMLRRRGRKVARKSQHTKGKALDFFMPDVSIKKLRELGLKAHKGGVGYYRGSFVHLDTGGVRHWPRMSRRQLSRVFPRGRTIHVPSNRKPLKGYKVAMRNIKKGLTYDGRKPRTRVTRPSLLARLFRRDEDEVEDAPALKATPKKEPPKAVAKPTPEKQEPAKPEPEKKKEPEPAVLVAAVMPKPKPARAPEPVTASGPDLFALEAEAAKKAEEQEPVPEATALVSSRVAVPRLRPSVSGEQSEEQKLDPLSATEIALATPPATTTILRPPADIPDTIASAEARPKIVATAKQDVEGLNRRIRSALTSQRKLSASEKAVEAQSVADLAARAKKLGKPLNSPKPEPATILARAALPTLRPVDEQPAVADEKTVLQASLQPTAQTVKRDDIAARIAEDSKPPVLKAPIKQKDSDLMAMKPPIPATVPAPVAEAVQMETEDGSSTVTVEKPILLVRALDAQKPKAELLLGDLDGASVKRWATSKSTRVGAMAALKAPAYKQCARRAAPTEIYAVGFSNKRPRLRAHEFTGAARVRVAFAEFDKLN